MQDSARVYSTLQGYWHWCPGCNERHLIPTTWRFNGSHDKPTFRPIIRIVRMTRQVVSGRWTGDVMRDGDGNIIPYRCHYVITWGQIHFYADSTHYLAGQTMRLPELPPS